MPSDEEDERSGGTSAGEWVLGALGGVVVLALLVFLVHQGVTRDTGPRVDVAVAQVEQTSAGFVVSVRTQNLGGKTAQGVLVTGEVVEDGTVIDSAQATVSYLAPQSTDMAVLVFATDPEQPGRELRLEVAGYTVL